jgi:hypothetical protein
LNKLYSHSRWPVKARRAACAMAALIWRAVGFMARSLRHLLGAE